MKLRFGLQDLPILETRLVTNDQILDQGLQTRDQSLEKTFQRLLSTIGGYDSVCRILQEYRLEQGLRTRQGTRLRLGTRDQNKLFYGLQAPQKTFKLKSDNDPIFEVFQYLTQLSSNIYHGGNNVKNYPKNQVNIQSDIEIQQFYFEMMRFCCTLIYQNYGNSLNAV